MRIGVLILPAQPWQQARHLWRLADEMGFAHAWTYDHIAWRDLIGETWFSAMTTLAAAAGVTRRTQLGTLVSTPNFRHPVPFAKEVVSLDDLSDGRFVLGLGAGAGGSDAEVLGQRPWSPAERSARFAEYVELTDLLLRNPIVNFSGTYYQASQARADPSGEVRARVRLAVGATGPRGMRVTAKHAEIWVTNGSSPKPGLVAPAASPQLVADQVNRLHEICLAEGRDPAGMRRLLLNVNREQPALASVEAFVDEVGRYREAGITDMVVPFPQGAPFQGDLAILEKIAVDVLPGLTTTAQE